MSIHQVCAIVYCELRQTLSCLSVLSYMALSRFFEPHLKGTLMRIKTLCTLSKQPYSPNSHSIRVTTVSGNQGVSSFCINLTVLTPRAQILAVAFLRDLLKVETPVLSCRIYSDGLGPNSGTNPEDSGEKMLCQGNGERRIIGKLRCEQRGFLKQAVQSPHWNGIERTCRPPACIHNNNTVYKTAMCNI